MDKKKIKVGFLGGVQQGSILEILKEKFDVEISKTPDFVFIGPYGDLFEYLKYDCVRIYYTHEPFSVDFSQIDYAVGFDYMVLLDKNGKNRFYRHPYNIAVVKDKTNLQCWEGYSREQAEEILKGKDKFCNFIYSHPSPLGQREELFDKLSAYKRVDSIGTYRNNMPDGYCVTRESNVNKTLLDEKLKFQSRCKFTIASESVSEAGFCTEKIMHAFEANTIPVYFGDPLVSRELNTKSFINVLDYESIDAAIEQVKYLDTHDDAYIDMLMQPKFVENNYVENNYNGLKKFLWSILEQDKDDAFRRQKFFFSNRKEGLMRLRLCNGLLKSILLTWHARLHIKNRKFLDKLSGKFKKNKKA